MEGPAALLYDGNCRLCRAGADRLLRMARRGSIELVDFQRPGALDAFPGLTHDACMRAIHLVQADGRFARGMQAVVEALATRGGLARLARAYYLPGLRQLLDALYAFVARHRYRLGRAPACDDEACAVHFGSGR
jgi:predicted DCC family thiol-disulfide oxidoreductase YuxK